MSNKTINTIGKDKAPGGTSTTPKAIPLAKKSVLELTNREIELITDTYLRIGTAKGAATELTKQNLLNISQSQVLNVLKGQGLITHTSLPRTTEDDTTDIGILDNQLYTIAELMVIFNKSKNKVHEAINTYSGKQRKEKLGVTKEEGPWDHIQSVFQNGNETEAEKSSPITKTDS